MLFSKLLSYLGEEYVWCGERLKRFMLGFCARRIVSLIRRSNARKREEKAFAVEYKKQVIRPGQKIPLSKQLTAKQL